MAGGAPSCDGTIGVGRTPGPLGAVPGVLRLWEECSRRTTRPGASLTKAFGLCQD